MRKRITSLLLTLVMLLSLVPAMGVTASAGEMLPFHEVGTYQELIDAVHSGKPRIKLKNDINTRDVYASGIGIPEDKMITIGYDAAITLDLNGCTLALETLVRGGFSFFTVYGELEIKDSSPSQNGKITGKFPSVLAAMFRTQGGTLTLQSGTLMTSSNKNDVITVGSSGGHVVINGGRICSGKWDTSSASPCGYAVLAVTDFADVEKMEVIINGGVFDGAVGFFPRSEFTCKEPRFHIYGGTFKQDVLLRCGQKTFKTHSPILEICGGSFEGGLKIYDWGMDPIDRYGDAAQSYPPFKLLGGTFSCTVDLCYEKSYWGFDSPKLDQFIGALKYERMRPVFAAMLENSAIVKPSDTYTAVNIDKGMDWALREGYGTYYQMLLKGTAANPIRIIRNAWGMKSVTLDGNPIDYFKDWNGTVERMDNSTAHTLKFEWYPLAQELKDAGYTYRANFDCYTVGSNTPTTSVPISATATEYSHTIPAGAAPSVYPFDLQLNLDKNGSSVGIIGNQHIVKLVVSEAPVVVPDPTIEGTVYYTSGIVYDRPISIAASVTPTTATPAYQWQRSTDSGSTWTNIEGATSGKYTPVAADMGDTVRIRVKVTAEGYLGEIIGAAVKVRKADNNNYPEVIQLEAEQDGAGNYTGFKITNFDSDCEYVYSTTDRPNWSANQISSATVTGLTSDTTYYVFARFKETTTHTAGSIVSSNSIKLYDNVPLQYVLLEGFDSGKTIYIKQGESVTLKVSADPSNANSWQKITFKDESGTATSNITIDNAEIAASTGTDIPFPNDHTITIKGVSTGSATLKASYPSATSSAYGTWNVVVYDETNVSDALRLENIYAYEDITLSVNDEVELPTGLPKLLPENSGYHLEWRILKRGTYGATYVTENDNIKLEDGKIKPKAAHTGSASTRLELVAVKEGETNVRSFSQTSRFNVTVTEAPVIELTGVTVAPTKVNLELNATYQLSAVKEPVNAAGSLSWESSNPGVATVDSTGKVTAKAQGTAIITVSCGDKKATCTVTVDHQHDYSGQPYLYLDPGNHYQECKAGDGYNIQAHEFTAWTDNGNGTHSRHCTVCKMTDGSTYTETAEHTWVWVVDQEAALGQPGKQHEECTGCHAKRSENTEIPALQDYAVTVTGGTATVAAGTPITRAMEGVEVTVTAQAPAGKHFVKWVVKAGGVTLANETSATTTFIMPANDVTIEAKLVENPFVDVSESSVYYDAILWAYYHEPQQITGGYTATEFRPGNPCTRGQVVTFLWRAAGCPEPTGDTSMFNDASSIAAPYQKAVAWAVEKGITTGYNDGSFRPNDSVTRAQFVTFLWRYEGKPATSGSIAGFTDAASIAEPYQQAVAWAVEKGITTGYNDGSFRPNATCTRWAVVLFMYRDMT